MAMKRPSKAPSMPKARGNVDGEVLSDKDERLPEQGSSSLAPVLPGLGTRPKVELSSPAKPKPKATAAKAKAKADPHPAIPKDAAKRMHSKLKTLEKAGRPELKDMYTKCKSQAEKRAFFYDIYCLDPNVSERSVTKHDEEDSRTIVDLDDDWYTAEEIAEKKGIKPGCQDYDLKVEASVKGMDERPHEDGNLAALGVKQYHFFKSTTKSQVVKKRKVQMEEKVEDVSQDDFAQMRQAMHSDLTQKMIGNSSSSGRSGLNKAQEGEVEVQVDWLQHYKDSYKKVKGSLTSMNTEVHALEVLKEKLSTSPETGMKQLVKDQLEAKSSALHNEKKKRMSERLLFAKEYKDEEEAKQKASDLNAMNEATQTFLKSFRKEIVVHKAAISS